MLIVSQKPHCRDKDQVPVASFGFLESTELSTLDIIATYLKLIISSQSKTIERYQMS